MKTTAKRTRKILGEITTVVVGTGHGEATVRPGQAVSLEREPSNPHDKNALRVNNAEGEKLGYIPRRVVSWLAPLIDRGYVQVKGGMAAAFPTADHRPPVTLTVYLLKDGEVLLKKRVNPPDAGEALHQVVLGAYGKVSRWETPRVPSELAGLLQAVDHKSVLPQTRLLLALFPFAERKARRSRVTRVLKRARAALGGVKVGAQVHFGNVSLFPLFASNGHDRDYLLVEEAIEADIGEVREVSEHGSVPELLFVNGGLLPVLIPEGQILVGAKQNRVVNMTVLVAAHSNFKVPVSCVEQGRWSHVSPNFQAWHYAPPGLRARKNSAVQENMARMGSASADQGEVWSDVEACLREAGASSRTGSITDAYEALQMEIDVYRKNLVLPEEATGVIVAIGGRLVGAEFYDSQRSFCRVWPRLSEAYFFEASTRRTVDEVALTESPEAFWQSLSRKLSCADGSMGLGVRLEIAESGLTGSAIWCNDRFYQMSALVLPAVEASQEFAELEY